MRRRDFITLLGGVAVTQPFAAHAQQALPAIGILHEGLPAPLSLTVAFQQGLIEGGISRGSSVKIENSSADGQYGQLPALAAELISHRVGIIVAVTSLPRAQQRLQLRRFLSYSLRVAIQLQRALYRALIARPATPQGLRSCSLDWAKKSGHVTRTRPKRCRNRCARKPE